LRLEVVLRLRSRFLSSVLPFSLTVSSVSRLLFRFLWNHGHLSQPRSLYFLVFDCCLCVRFLVGGSVVSVNQLWWLLQRLFLPGKPFLCKQRIRTKVKGAIFKAASSPEQELGRKARDHSTTILPTLFFCFCSVPSKMKPSNFSLSPPASLALLLSRLRPNSALLW
jgi:hypothetical protein